MIAMCRQEELPQSRRSQKRKKRNGKLPEVLNFQERIDKTAQVLSNLHENFFDFFDFAVTAFCGSSLG
jgi:hypothetical protein